MLAPLLPHKGAFTDLKDWVGQAGLGASRANRVYLLDSVL